MKLSSGFTLIEVLIALTIIALSLTAAISASSESSRRLSHLEQRSLAEWIGQNELNRLLTGQAGYYLAAGQQQGQVQMMDQNWRWQAKTERLQQDNFHLTVQVHSNANDELLAEVEYYGVMHGR